MGWNPQGKERGDIGDDTGTLSVVIYRLTWQAVGSLGELLKSGRRIRFNGMILFVAYAPNGVVKANDDDNSVWVRIFSFCCHKYLFN